MPTAKHSLGPQSSCQPLLRAPNRADCARGYTGELEPDRDAASRTASTNRKIDIALLPLLSLLYLFNGLDRGNIGSAQTQGFTDDIGCQPDDLNLAVSLFWLTFVLLQPLSAVGAWLGARHWIPLIMVCWGTVTVAQTFIWGRASLIATRLLIGAFEASFYPTAVAYLALFYHPADLGGRIAVLYGLYAVSSAFSGAIAYGIFRLEHQTLKPWQLLFLIEGTLTVILAAAAWLWLPSDPGTAWFLTEEERMSAKDRAQPDDAGGDRVPGVSRRDLVETARDWKLWFVLVCNICASVPATAFAVFLPLVVEGMGYTSIEANLMSVPPAVCGALGLGLFAASSGRRREHGYHIVVAILIVLVGLVAVMTASTNTGRYAALCVLLFGSHVSAPLTTAWLSTNTPAPGKRAWVLGVNGWGNLAGVIGSQLYRAEYAPTYRTPFLATLGFVAASLVGYLSYRFTLEAVNGRRAAIGHVKSHAEAQTERRDDERYADRKWTFVYTFPGPKLLPPAPRGLPADSKTQLALTRSSLHERVTDPFLPPPTGTATERKLDLPLPERPGRHSPPTRACHLHRSLPKSPSKSDLASPPAASSSSSLTRLPVNPRREKVPLDKRKRVATACNSCNVRRIKCSGHKPCQQCAGATRDCQYPEPVLKRTIPQVEHDDLLLIRKLAAEEYAEKHGHILGTRLTADERRRAIALLLGDVNAPLPAIRNGKLLEDAAGTKRYLGMTSGACFLDSVRDFMGEVYKAISQNPANSLEFDTTFLNSRGRYETFESRPLELPDDIDPRAVPPREDVDRMLKSLRRLLQDGPPETGGFSCGGIFFWPLGNLESLETSWDATIRTSPTSPPEIQSYRWLAKFQAAFALATLLEQRTAGSRAEGNHLGDVYFERAVMLLGNRLDRSTQFRVEDIPAMTLMAMYLLENNRRDRARHYVCIAMDVCVEHGANSVASGNPLPQSQQRAFWTLYILDRWLSCLMGRPPYYPDDMSNMTLPEPQECSGLPSPAGLRAHVELSEISTYIVRHNHKAPLPIGEAPEFLKRAHAKLQAWKEGLPEDLKLPKEGPVFNDFTKETQVLDPLKRFKKGSDYVDRAVCMLHMAHNQLYILTVRPMFLIIVRKKVYKALKGAVNDELQDIKMSRMDVDDAEAQEQEKEDMLEKCTDLARNTISLALTARDTSDGLVLVQDLHHLFNAALILMLNQMYYVNLQSTDTAHIAEAIKVFEREKLTGNAFCIECAGVLNGLHKLVHQLRPAIFEGSAIQGTPGLRLAPSKMHEWESTPDMAGYSDARWMVDMVEMVVDRLG
ncbi:high-affinity nicotinic acid transporter [Podospora conica]|nr:high-affinity nicotinic acid transporter [Schizothecium conicum]